eukprot:TRINITY_DN5581_c0_g1_i1.p1 TRINITY_DN5581_c0_g1~~TRINITY_DN5581_c0_g1_i1.p1  ORF type:complete len:1195 (+),score=193.88 TRINITY_DN5581_c0_g1_i1:106-3690(+)
MSQTVDWEWLVEEAKPTGSLHAATSLRINASEETFLPAGISDFSSLVQLHIVGAQLTSLPQEVSKLSLLTGLLMEGDDVIEMSEFPTVLQHLVHLQSLVIRRNMISHIPEWVTQLTQLSTFVVESDELDTLPRGISLLPCYRSNRASELKRFRLSYGTQAIHTGDQLHLFPAALNLLNSVTCIDISNNMISFLPEGIGALTGLKAFIAGSNAGGNQLSRLPESFSQLTNLQSLSLQHNHFMHTPKWITSMVSLQDLNLSHNQLKQFPYLGALSALSSLEIGQNPFDYLVNVILESFHKNEGFIGLSSRKLTTVPDVLTRFPPCWADKILSVDLSNNLISSLPSWICHLRSLQKLNLESNHIQRLPSTLCDLESLQEIRLLGNTLGEEEQPLQSVGWPKIRQYLDQRTQTNGLGLKCRVVFIGNPGAGKYSLIKSLMQRKGPFKSSCSDAPQTRSGIRLFKNALCAQAGEKELKFGFIHCSSLHEFMVLSSLLVSPVTLLVFVWDMALGVKKSGFSTWADYISVAHPGANILAIATNSDHPRFSLPGPASQVLMDFRRLCVDYQSTLTICDSVPVSNKTGYNIPVAVYYLTQMMAQIYDTSVVISPAEARFLEAATSIASGGSCFQTQLHLLQRIPGAEKDKDAFLFQLLKLVEFGDILLPFDQAGPMNCLNAKIFFKAVSLCVQSVRKSGNLGACSTSGLLYVLECRFPGLSHEILDVLLATGMAIPSQDGRHHIFPSLLTDCEPPMWLWPRPTPVSCGSSATLQVKLAYPLGNAMSYIIHMIYSAHPLITTRDSRDGFISQSNFVQRCLLLDDSSSVLGACLVRCQLLADHCTIYISVRADSEGPKASVYITMLHDRLVQMFPGCVISHVCPKCLYFASSPDGCGSVPYGNPTQICDQVAFEDSDVQIVRCTMGHHYEYRYLVDGLCNAGQVELPKQGLPQLYRLSRQQATSATEMSDIRLHMLCDNPFEPHLTTHSGYPIKTRLLAERGLHEEILALLGIDRRSIQEDLSHPKTIEGILQDYLSRHPLPDIRATNPLVVQRLFSVLDPTLNWTFALKETALPNSQHRYLCHACAKMFEKGITTDYVLQGCSSQVFYRKEIDPDIWHSGYFVLDLSRKAIIASSDELLLKEAFAIDLSAKFQTSDALVALDTTCLRIETESSGPLLIMFPSDIDRARWIYALARFSNGNQESP